MNSLKLICLLCTCSLVLSLAGQNTRTELSFSGTSISYTDIGVKGVIVSSQSGKVVNAALIDPTGKLVWSKTIEYAKAFRYVCCASPDGNDFYVLMYWKSKAKGGTEGFTLSRINTSDGEITTKEYAEATPGHALVTYATNTAFYLVTTPQEWSNHKSNDYTTSLLRFDKKDLSYTTSSAEMNITYDKDKLFWQFYKVEQSYIEGYRVAEQNGKTLKLEIARFDTTGKKIFSKDATLELKEGFAVPTTTYLPRYKAISQVVSTIESQWMTSNGTSIGVVDLLSLAHLVYDEESKTFMIFGTMGPAIWKNNNCDYNGYYLARLDVDFNLVKLVERSTIPLISNSILGSSLHKDQRNCTGYFQPSNKFTIMMFALKTQVMITCDVTSLEEKSAANYSKDIYATHNAFMPEMNDLLWYDANVVAEKKHFSGLALFANRNLQMACVYAYDGSGAVVFTKKNK